MFAQNAFCADGLKEVLTPYQREVNMRSRALLATAGSEVRSSGNMEHSASELKLVGRVGNLAKSGKALKKDLLPFCLRGWGQYFRVANCASLFSDLMEWIRRRLRMKKMREWKSWKAFHKQLRRNGFKGECPKISMTRWRNSACFHMSFALPNKWFKEMKLFNLTSIKIGVLFSYVE